VRLPLLEMWRRPARFVRAGAALVVLVMLLVVLGGLTDGLTLGANAAFRAQTGQLVVFSDDARLSLLRSRVEAEVADEVAELEGVEAVRPLGVALVGATREGEGESIPAAVLATTGGVEGIDEAPAEGTALVDAGFADEGVEVGDTLELGPTGVPVEVAGFVGDSSYLYQLGVWTSPATWRTVLAEVRPDAVFTPEQSQAIVLDAPGLDDAELEGLAERIDEATGTTETVTVEEAGLALPGVTQQASTFRAIIGTTFFVVGLVVALFFVLLTIEHLPLFAVLKALGASDRQVTGGVVVQAMAVAVGAGVIGIAVSFGLGVLLSSVTPFTFTVSRAVQVLVGVVVVSVIGSLVSLRRVRRVEPASVIS
jgi:putative ABC transport system permease protein